MIVYSESKSRFRADVFANRIDYFVIRDGRAVVDAARRAPADRTVHGYKRLLKQDPVAARQKAELIVKNTYRTLMTRGMKGCYVYSVDEETNAYFSSFAR